MSLYRHPLWDPGECDRRGRHGPFVNADRFADFPGWEGMADCAMCGSTVIRPGEPALELLRTRVDPRQP